MRHGTYAAFFLTIIYAFKALRFLIPDHSAIRKFDEITVELIPDVEHSLIAPELAIEQFHLFPRSSLILGDSFVDTNVADFGSRKMAQRISVRLLGDNNAHALDRAFFRQTRPMDIVRVAPKTGS